MKGHNYLREIIPTDAVVWRCSVEKVFLEISKIHRKTPVPQYLCLFFNKVAGLEQLLLPNFSFIKKIKAEHTKNKQNSQK